MNHANITEINTEDISDQQMFWTEADFRHYLHISQPTSLKIIHQPGFPLIRVGRSLRMIRADVLVWLREQSINGNNIVGGNGSAN